MQPFRVEPAGPAAAYKTYAVAAPLASHFRPASCAEANCRAHTGGWLTACDLRTDVGAGQAHYIRAESGRRYVEHPGQTATPVADPGGGTRIEWADAPGMTVFEFPPGQRCFGSHQVPLDKPEIYTVRGGDWRGDPARIGVYRHVHVADWVDDFGTHQQNIADRAERG